MNHADIAVLFMSMHMYFQIFPPKNTRMGHDGLYRFRHWILAAFIIGPNLSASLAFVNPRAAYMAQGPFCTLPLRPIWYRLALFWIPRYSIWLYIIYVAVRIYRHAGSEFKIFGALNGADTSVDIPRRPSTVSAVGRRESVWSNGGSVFTGTNGSEKGTDTPKYTINLAKGRQLDLEALSAHAGRRHSVPTWAMAPPDINSDESHKGPTSRSTPTSRRGSQQVAPTDIVPTATLTKVDSRPVSMPPQPDRPLAPTRERSSVQSPRHSEQFCRGMDAVIQRRQAIQRQLRLLFIYPMVYLMVWLIPFVVNIMNYTSWAQHPVYALQILQVIMLTMMTTIDVVVFSWRETPWRHIPGSDGTFVGSLMWWRFCFEDTWIESRRTDTRTMSGATEHAPRDAEKAQEKPRSWLSFGSLSLWKSNTPSSGSRRSSPAKAQTVVHHRQFSGGSDRKVRAAEMAHERLAMERSEYERNRLSLQEARASVIESLPSSTPTRKEWFDKDLQGDLFTDHDRDTNTNGEEV